MPHQHMKGHSVPQTLGLVAVGVGGHTHSI